jgi:hypothetical protein
MSHAYVSVGAPQSWLRPAGFDWRGSVEEARRARATIEGDTSMRNFRRHPVDTPASEAAGHAVKASEGGRAAAIISAIALFFSAYSLWETSLKQADLGVYATGVISYGRDTSDDASVQPSGGFEVLVVPVTIANGGARDGVVLSLQLDVKNPKTGLSARFDATYTADATYFADARSKRPKTPFNALVIAGRSAWTGTVIFYPVSYSNAKSLTPISQVAAFNDALRKKYAGEMGGASSLSVLREKLPNLPELAELDAYYAKVLEQNGTVEVRLRLTTPSPGGWLDRMLGTPVPPILLTLGMPDIQEDRVARGEIVRLRTTAVGS